MSVQSVMSFNGVSTYMCPVAALRPKNGISLTDAVSECVVPRYGLDVGCDCIRLLDGYVNVSLIMQQYKFSLKN